jgi:hypothetical protein
MLFQQNVIRSKDVLFFLVFVYRMKTRLKNGQNTEFWKISCASVISAVHFLRIFQWWGKTAKRPIFVAPPQDSMRSAKMWAEYRRHELARGIWGYAPQEIIKIWVSEIAFPAFWEHIFKKSHLLKTQAVQSCKGQYNVYYSKNMS